MTRSLFRQAAFMAALLTAFSLWTVSAETTPTTSATTTTASSGTTTTVTATEATTTTAAPAEDDAKTYTISMENGTGVIREEPSTRTFWEYPLLTAGQERRGTLTIVNNTGDDLEFTGTAVELPYTDAQALAYLTQLTLTVEGAGGAVLYHGQYTDVVGQGGSNLVFFALPAGETAVYTITVKCAFAYTGTPEQETAAVAWKLRAQQAETVEPAGNTGVRVLGIGLGILALAGITLAVLRRVRRRTEAPREE